MSDPETTPRALPTQTPRVLVVDDEPQVARALERLLRRSGFAVLAVGSPETALDALDPFAPDAVITDYRMPGLDGGALLRMVAARRPSAVRILLSGYTGPALAGAVGHADELLAKPWDDDAVVSTLRARLGRAP